jgi:glycosyltransferase involved in cell wall biosynthesis
MKTLYVNGRYLSQPITGVQRYARDVVEAWDDDLEEGRIDRSEYSIQLVSPKRILEPPAYKRVCVVGSRFSGKLWEQGELPLRTAGSLLFSPYAVAPALKRRQVVTIHDAGVLATPQQYSRAFRTYYAAVYRSLGMVCQRILTVSNFSRDELHKYFSIPFEKLRVVHPGCDHLLKLQADHQILRKFALEPGTFILGVSSRSPIKNFNGLIQAWAAHGRPGVKLAIAGKMNSRVFRQNIENHEGVIWLGYVSDGELRSLYENAALFAYPSFYEGFGYPPLEAMSCGCPVVVAESSALPESCGDAAVYCDPTRVEDIARAIHLILDNKGFANELREKGKTHASRFTMKASASRIWEEISSCI